MLSETARPEAQAAGGKPPRKVLATTASVVAIVGTLVGLYFALWPRTPVRTLEQWSREASAVCEQYRGELMTGYREATDRLNAVIDEGSGTSADVAAALDDASNVYRAMVGRIRALEPPTDEADARRVDAALSATEQLDAAWARTATTVEQLDLGAPTTDELMAVVGMIDAAEMQAQTTTEAFIAAGTPACGLN